VENPDFVVRSFFAFGLALLRPYIFFDTAAQFESFIDPFIIILTVPMAAGALFSLWHQTWNIFSQIGTVMLIGFVTKKI
jgi:HAE1 family hydrophobic/amphiphilic exporter-1/multidrug efflux pump